jgi:short-subunit dehydrogenase
VIVSGRDPEALEAMAARTRGTAVRCDLSEPGAAARLAEEALQAHGRVDVVVNDAGEGRARRLVDTAEADIERLTRVNLVAAMELTRALLPGMLERRRGHVVNVASIAGHVGVRDEAVYASTKAGLIAFSESLRYELAGSGIGVSLVTPGIVRTAFFERRGRPYHRTFPRPVAPERVAGAIVSAIEGDRSEVFVPRWMTIPARLRGATPGIYRFLAGRFG